MCSERDECEVPELDELSLCQARIGARWGRVIFDEISIGIQLQLAVARSVLRVICELGKRILVQ